jgi:hypothetical protein
MTAPDGGSPPDEPQAAGGDGAPSTPPGSPRFAREVRARIKRWLKKPPDTSRRLWTCLLITLFVDGIAAFALAAGEFIVAREETFVFFAALGAGILTVIALANLWALISVGRGAQSWARDAFIAQLFVFFLALYIAWVSFQSSPLNWRAQTLAAVALMFSLVALVWLLLLWGRAALQWKAAAILGALVPIVGVGQFWLQNFYIPQTTAPLVDFSANLSPQGRDGLTTHFSAKVTVHNRGAAAVRVAGALMRVTAYETAAQSREVLPECEGWNGSYDYKCVQKFLDLSGNSYNTDFRADRDYRVDPTLAKNAKPAYIGLLMPGPRYALNPGDTQHFQREVDINSNVRLVRLSASAVFLTIRTISGVRSCANPKDPNSKPVSSDSDPQKFVDKVRKPIPLPLDPKGEQNRPVLCKDYEIARTNIVDKLIGARPVIRVMVVLDDPQGGDLEHPQLDYLEHPQLDYWYGFAGEGDQFSRAEPRVGQKIAAANPMAVYKDVSVECVSGDQPKCDEKVQAGEPPPVTTPGH